MSETTIGPACPKCGCHLRKHFACSCGACKSDYCVNCGRFTSLRPDESVELSGFDERCTAGAVAHEHSEVEKAARIDRWFDAQLSAARAAEASS